MTFDDFLRDIVADAIGPSREDCTCPSGDGSLRWPCPSHPPTGTELAVSGREDER